MFSRFKTLKDVLTAQDLVGDDLLARRAVIVIQKTTALKKRAFHAGHRGVYIDCDEVMTYAALALGGLDRLHRYAFLDVSELPVDVRLLAQHNQHIVVGSNDADELLTLAEGGFQAMDELVGVPGVIIEGLAHNFILRGDHCDQAMALMAPPAKVNDRGPRAV
jgi:hypothetical protein